MKPSPIKAALALTMIDTGKTAEQVLFEAGLNSNSAAQLREIVLSHTAQQLYALLGNIQKPRFSKYAI